MKTKLRLDTVLKIKEDLERDIGELQKDITKYNETEKKVDALLGTLHKKMDQLIEIKESIQEANKGKHKDGKTNNYYIYHLSNLKNRKILYSQLGSRSKSAQISVEDANKIIRETDEEMDKVRNKLTLYNTSKTITVKVDESLGLL